MDAQQRDVAEEESPADEKEDGPFHVVVVEAVDGRGIYQASRGHLYASSLLSSRAAELGVGNGKLRCGEGGQAREESRSRLETL